MEIKVTKDMRNSWSAINDFELGENDRFLRIQTMKVYSGALRTTATVHRREGSSVVTVMTIGMDDGTSDYRKTMVETRPARVTSKTVAGQHGDAIARAGTMLADAIAFYAARKVPA